MREKQRPQSQTMAATAGSCCFLLISPRLFQLTTRYRRSRVRERARVRQLHRPSSLSRLPSGVWTSANRPTGRRDGAQGCVLRPLSLPMALRFPSGPMPSCRRARGEPMRPNDEFGCQMKSARPSSSSKERGHSKPQRQACHSGVKRRHRPVVCLPLAPAASRSSSLAPSLAASFTLAIRRARSCLLALALSSSLSSA